jgi:hypothetical protein
MSATRAVGYTVGSIEADRRVNTGAKCLLFGTMHQAKGSKFLDVIVTSTRVGNGERGEVAPQLIYVGWTRARRRRATFLPTN